MPRLKISDAPLLGSIVGDEKIPTGKYGDYTLTPDMIVSFAQGKLPFVTQVELAQVKTQLENSINTVQTTLSADIGVLSGKIDGMESQVLGVTQDLTIHKTDSNNPHQVTKAQVGLGNVDNTSDANKPISTATQAALSQKISSVNGKTGNSITLTRDDVGVPTDEQIKAFTKEAKYILDESGLTQQELNSNLSFPLNVLSSKISRTLYSHIKDYVDVKDYGAIGDNTLHTVQEWIDSGKFSSLVEIKLVFPHVSALTDSIDWAAIQLCMSMRKNVYIPSGRYLLGKKTVHTSHSGSPNRVDSGAYIFGDGCSTVLSRGEVSEPASRELNSDGTLNINAIDDENNNEAVFSIHGSYFKFSDFIIQNSRVGFYFGQDLSNTEKSACYKNIIRDVQIRRCGTGIIMSSASGNHYNDISNIHFIENQIDCEMRNGKHDIVSISNNNRNYFTNIRSNRAIVGLWCSSGDTNRFTSWDGENCGATPVNNPYSTPLGLPKLSDGSQITNGVHILTREGQLNKFLMCQMESCDIELYNDHFESIFIANGYHEAVANGLQVYNLKEPKQWLSNNTTFNQYFSATLNINANAFPSVVNTGFVLKGTPPRNNTGRFITRLSQTSNSISEKRMYTLGSAVASEVKTVTIWGDVDPSSSANIKVRVSALSTSANLSFANEFIVCANRAANRSLSRYFLSEISKIRASGQNAGDSTTVIIPSVTNGGTSTRELVLSLAMPAYAFDSVLVEVELLVNRG